LHCMEDGIGRWWGHVQRNCLWPHYGTYIATPYLVNADATITSTTLSYGFVDLCTSLGHWVLGGIGLLLVKLITSCTIIPSIATKQQRTIPRLGILTQ
jgi:hypothetical protein